MSSPSHTGFPILVLGLALAIGGGASGCATSSTSASGATSSGTRCGLRDSANSANSTAADAYSSGTNTLSSPGVDASARNESAICVENSGTSLTITDPDILTRGASSDLDDSSFYGLDAAILAYGSSSSTVSGGAITLTGGSITTSGQGANAVFASGAGAGVSIADTTIVTTGYNAHALDATYGGALIISNVTATTSGVSSSVIATDRGGGTVIVNGGNYTASGRRSAGLYSTGNITVTNGTFTANDAAAAVVEGSNSLTLTGTSLIGRDGAGRAVFIYQSTSGDAAGGAGSFTMTGGSIRYSCAASRCLSDSSAGGRSNPATLFAIANTTATISLKNVTITHNVAALLTAAALNSGIWGTAGSNGGHVTMTTAGTALTGDLIVDGISTAVLSLTDGSSLTGAINAANTGESVTLTLDSTSTWTVTGTSHLTTLSGAQISGGTVTNLIGRGYDVYYLPVDNPSLSDASYALYGSFGGELLPEQSRPDPMPRKTGPAQNRD